MFIATFKLNFIINNNSIIEGINDRDILLIKIGAEIIIEITKGEIVDRFILKKIKEYIKKIL